MEYKDLLAGLDHAGTPPAGEATAIVQDSRRVIAGSVFVCVVGRGFDGHDFAKAALDAGAGMIVSERALGLPNEVTVADSRAAYAVMSHHFFGNPAERLQLIGVTGTNGKTTVASVLKQTLERLGLRCGLIGTFGSEIGEVEIPAKFTTPEAFDLAALFARMERAGCTHVVMEASSQALEQKRLYGLRFALGIFTNLSQDHLDYHGDMQRYFEAKKLLFAQSDAMLVNLDDAFGRRLMDEGEAEMKKSFSLERNMADYMARNVELRADGVRFAFLGEGFLEPVQFSIPGEYSASNALAVASAAVMLGQAPAAVARAVSAVPGVKGRCEVLCAKPFTVIRDFAHTPDGIDKLLGSLKPYVNGKLVVLFGNAGDRDATKRPAMGEAVARWADEIVLTADNPRTEDVEKTMEDSMGSIREAKRPCTLEPDRETAVHLALDRLGEGDMLVLCTKGHEDYQVMNGVSLYLDERQIVEEWMRRQGL